MTTPRPTTANGLATLIMTRIEEIYDLLELADDILQSDDMPEPYEQWNAAVDAVQDAMLEAGEGGDLHDRARLACTALRASGLYIKPEEAA